MDSPRSPEISEPIPIDSVPIKPVPIEAIPNEPVPSHTTIASSPLMPSSPSSALVTVSTVAPVFGNRTDESEDSFLQNGSIDQTMSQQYSNVSGDAVISGNVSGTTVMPTIPFIKMEPEEILCEPTLPVTMLSIVKMPSVDIPPGEFAPEEIAPEGILPEEIPPEGILPEEIPPEEMLSESLPSTETIPSDPKPSEPMSSTENIPTDAIPSAPILNEKMPSEKMPSETLPSNETMLSDPIPSSKAIMPNPKMRSNPSQAKKKSCRNAMQPSTRVQLGLRLNPSKTVTFTEKMPTIKRSNEQPQAKKNICQKKQATMLSTVVPRALPSEPLTTQPMPTPEAILPNSAIHPNVNICQASPSTVTFWRPWEPKPTNPPPKKNIICRNIQATSTVNPRALPSEPMPSEPMPTPEAVLPNSTIHPNVPQSNANICQAKNPTSPSTVTFWRPWEPTNPQPKKNIICLKIEATMEPSTVDPRALPSEPIPSELMPSEPLPSEPMPTPVLGTVSIPPYEPILYSPNIYQYAPQVMKNICPMVQATSTVDPRALSSEPVPSEPVPSEPVPSEPMPSEPMPFELMPTPEAKLPNSTIHPNASNANICQAKNPSTVTFWRPWEPKPTNPPPKKNIICRKKLRQAAMSSTLASGTMLGQTMSSYRYILPKTDRMSMPSTINSSTTVVIRTMPNGQDSVAQVPECIDLTKDGQPVIGSFRTLIGEQMPLRELSNMKGPGMQHQTSRLVLNKAMPSTTMGIKTMGIKPLGIKAINIKTPSIKPLGIKTINIKTPSIKPLGIKTINIKTPSIKTKSIKRLDTMHECIWSGCAYKSNHKGNTVKHVRAIHLRLPVTLKKMEQSGMELSDKWSKWIRSSKI